MEEGFTRRLFLPDVRTPHRYMRVTWHADTSTVVWSHWEGEVCTASTPVSLDDASKLIGLLVGALKETALRSTRTAVTDIPARSLVGRLRARLRPSLAQVVKLHDRRHDRSVSRRGDAL